MMLGYMHQWVEGLGLKKRSMLERLTKGSVREHKNVLRRGETGVSKALVNPLGLPTLEDLKSELSPPPDDAANLVGKHQGKRIYFSADAYGKGGDASPASRGIDPSSPFSSMYSPSIADSEASSQDQQGYQWTSGLPREGKGSISGSTEDFYSAQKSGSSPATPDFYSPPPDPPQSAEDFYSARPNPQRSVTEGHTALGPSQAAQDFYGSPGPDSPPFQSPIQGPPRPGDQPSRNPFHRQMSSPPQLQTRGMDPYTQNPLQGSRSQPPHNPYPSQTPQISPEAASFYGSPPIQPSQPASRPRGKRSHAPPQGSDQDGQNDPLAELTASLRKF